MPTRSAGPVDCAFACFAADGHDSAGASFGEPLLGPDSPADSGAELLLDEADLFLLPGGC